MAKPINTPIAGEIWHLSIEDLFAPVHETQRLGGDGPFVINLSVSTAPIILPAKQFTARWDAHVYQIQVTEDGRTRYRLRLGPFRTEDDVEAILEDVREMYPGALTATAGAPDLRAIASIEAKLEAAAKPKAPPPKKPEKALEVTFDLEQPLARAAAIVAKTLGETAKHKNRAAPAKRTAAIAPPAAPSAAAAAPPVANPPPELSPAWALPQSNIRATPKQSAASAPMSVETPALQIAPAPKPAAAALANPAPVLTEVVAVSVPRKMPATAPRTPHLFEPIAPSTLEPPMPAAPYKPAPAATRIPEVAAKIIATPAATPVLSEAAASMTLEPPVPAAPSKPAPAATRIPEVAAKIVATPAATPVFVAAAAPITLEPPVAVAPDKAAPVLTLAPKPTSSAPAPAAKTQVPRPVAPRWTTPRWAGPRPAVPRPLASRPAAPTAAAPGSMAQSPLVPPAAAPNINSLQPKFAPPQLVGVAHVPAARPVKELSEPLASLESTQTIRALTAPELENEDSLRWFVIQLATADNAFDPDSVPNLDIFGEYRLYSVACVDQGHHVHALRLGFFSEEIAAVAVASYLSAHYEKPTIRRVSVAERERFALQRVEARKNVGETGTHAAIEITNELVARRRRNTAAASKPEKSGKGVGPQSPAPR